MRATARAIVHADEEYKMRVGSKGPIISIAGCLIVWLSAVVLASGQSAPTEKPAVSEEVFKNVQVLKGISVNEFMGTMGVFSAALGMSCEDCHAADDSKWENYATDNPRKQTARRMIVMMASINKTNFGGRQVVTCYSCHRGSDRPKLTPNLTTIYTTPVEDPNDFIGQARNAPPPDEVLDKYIKAVGGLERLAALKSFSAKGISVGYGPEGEKRPVEVFAKAPNQLTRIIHTASGDNTTTYDGRVAWIAAPHRPVAVLGLTGHDLEGARLDATLAFPSGIKQALTKWRVGFATTINDREVQVVQGTSASGALATLYFDAESGLLVRQVRYSESPVGRIPTLVDYADYREVAGVKIPFRWTVTWLDGRDSFELQEVQPNVPIDASKFARPAAPVKK
jgi:outer membrane lipoprotein-sorting protein